MVVGRSGMGAEFSLRRVFRHRLEIRSEYLRGKVLVPFLGKQYGEVLDDGDLELRFETDGSLSVWAYDTHKLPVCPIDYGDVLGSEHPELERLGDAFANVRNHAPNVVRRAQDLKRALSQAASA